MRLEFPKWINIGKLMWIARYKKHKGEFIKPDHHGRFHFRNLGKGEYDLHYDLLVEWRHVVFPMPKKLGSERGRLYGIAKSALGYNKPLEPFVKMPRTMAEAEGVDKSLAM